MDSGEILQDVFFRTNALPLGDVAYSMHIRDSLAYVVVNNSGRIFVMDPETFRLKGKITGLVSPRHLHFLSDTRAYVSDLYGQAVAIVDPQSMEVTGNIDVRNPDGGFYQHSTEQLVQYDRFVYTNCWSFDNKVLVIDAEKDRVVDSITVLKQPNSMVLDRNHNLWILSDGGFPGSPYGYEAPGLMKLVPGSREVEVVHRFPEGEKPTALTINGSRDTLYFLNRHVYRYVPGVDEVPRVFLSSPYEGVYQGGFYGLAVDPATSEVYVSDAIDHVQPGMVYRLAPSGMPLDSFRVGISPGGFCFKPG
jgi:DNA-binding beta-propeller fold protein YncE